MAGPWEAFQDQTAATLARNDEGIVAPPRAPVQSSPKVWGDAEAQSAGLYEAAGPWEAFKSRAPVRITVHARPVAERFGEMQPPATGGETLQRGLDQRGLELNRGPELQPAAQMLIDANNQVAAASQGTTPHVNNYGGKLISTQTFEDDGGNILYRDPETGAVKPTDNAKQIAIRDPADGVVKVFARSEATNESPAVGVSRVLAPGLAAGAVTSRPAIAAAPTAVVKASDIFSTAKPYYRAFKNEAGRIEIPAETATGIAERMRRALDKANFIPELADPIYKATTILERGSGHTLDDLQNIKRVVGRGFNSSDKNIRDAAAVASSEIGKIISEVSQTAGQNLKTADAIHSTARSVQDLQRKADISQLRTGRAGYGGNAVNSMRQVLSPIVQRAIEGKTTGFKPNEIAAMREIVEGTTATNALRQVGAMSPSKGIMQVAAAGATAGISAALGGAANKLAAVLTGKQVERLNELVAKRSPAYAEAVAKAVTRFEKAQMEVANNPTPNKFAAYISASRALSAGLTRDGIQISSGDLIKQLTGPIKSAADDQQNPVERPSGQ